LFEDGTSATGELLIGADGVHSTIRPAIDPAAPSPRHTGLNTIYGYTRDIPEHLTSPHQYRMISGKHAFLGYTTAPDGETWWFANAPGQELSRPHETTPDEWKQRLIALFRKDKTPTADIIKATGNNIVASNAYDLPTTPTWHRNNLIIIGDAAQPPLPTPPKVPQWPQKTPSSSPNAYETYRTSTRHSPSTNTCADNESNASSLPAHTWAPAKP
jgi:2-polyprenyl-6-methoxyphenol hydroxylase-like FAD-dependent oxidoreductase